MANLDPGRALGVAMSAPTLDNLKVLGSTTMDGGGTLGDSATDLVGFHGAAVVQANAITSVGTSIPVAACATFGLTSTQLTAMVTAVNALIVMAQNKGLTA